MDRALVAEEKACPVTILKASKKTKIAADHKNIRQLKAELRADIIQPRLQDEILQWDGLVCTSTQENTTCHMVVGQMKCSLGSTEEFHLDVWKTVMNPNFRYFFTEYRIKFIN
jgi:hypothetical protein